MSLEDLNRLALALSEDPALNDEFQSLEEDPAVWVAWAQTKGFTLTLEEAEQLGGEISDEDLDQVAGGWAGNNPPPDPPPGGGP
ncbi:MAG: Nif11-like leader peptide family RiPP precursor [Acidobacteriota bacterium]